MVPRTDAVTLSAGRYHVDISLDASLGDISFSVWEEDKELLKGIGRPQLKDLIHALYSASEAMGIDPYGF